MSTSFSADDLAELRPIFSALSHRTGHISAADLYPVLKSINRTQYTEPSVEALLTQYDRNGNGYLEWEEFLSFMASLSEDDNIALRQSINVTSADYQPLPTSVEPTRRVSSQSSGSGGGRSPSVPSSASFEGIHPAALLNPAFARPHQSRTPSPTPSPTLTPDTGSSLSRRRRADSSSNASSSYKSVPSTTTTVNTSTSTTSTAHSAVPSSAAAQTVTFNPPTVVLPPPGPNLRQSSITLATLSSLPPPPELVHTSSAVTAAPIDLYSAVKYFYIVLATATTTPATSSSTSAPVYVLSLQDPPPPTTGGNIITKTASTLINVPLTVGSVVTNAVTNTVAGVTGLDNKFKIGKMRLRLVRRGGRINEKWFIGEDGLIYSAWKKDYVLGGKPCRFYEIKTETLDSDDVSTSSSSSSSSGVSDNPLGAVGDYGQPPAANIREKLGAPVTARDLTWKGGLKGVTGLICRAPARSLSSNDVLGGASTTTGVFGGGMGKQLGVLRQCCGEEECEREKVTDGVECGFIAVNGEEERDDTTAVTATASSSNSSGISISAPHPVVEAMGPTSLPPAAAVVGAAVPVRWAQPLQVGSGTKLSEESKEEDGTKKKEKRSSGGFFHLPHLSSSKKKEKKKAEEEQRAALMAEKARVEAEKQANIRRQQELLAAQQAAAAANKPVTATAAALHPNAPSLTTQHSSTNAAASSAKPGRFLELHKWRIESEFVAFLYDNVYGVLFDYMSHLSFVQYQKQVDLHQRKETEHTASVVRTPIQTTVDWEWQPIWSTEVSGRGGLGGEVSVWRPVVPPGCVFFGDYAHSRKSVPVERVTVAQMHVAFARPKLFQKVWERKTSSGTIYFWSPVPPSDEYQPLGLVCTLSPVAPSADQLAVVVVHRSYLKFNHTQLKQQVYAETGDREWSMWRTPAPLSTVAVSSFASQPPNGYYFTLLEAYEPSEPSPLSQPVQTYTGNGGVEDWQLLWDDRNTLTNRSCSFWRPKLRDGAVRFGDMALLGHDVPGTGAVTALDHPGFRRPLTYELEYKMHRSNKRCYIWRPVVANSDYEVLGFIATAHSEPPPLDAMRVVHRALLLPYGHVEQAWLESNSDVQNMTLLNAGRYVVGGAVGAVVGGGNDDGKYGEAMVWRNISTRTFFMYKNTHRGPSLPHYRLPMSQVDHMQVVARLEDHGTSMMQACLGLLETVQQTVQVTQYKKLGLLPRQVAVLLQAVRGCLHYAGDSDEQEDQFHFSEAFLLRLRPMRAQMASIHTTLKRYVYDTVAAHDGDMEEQVILLDTLYPIMVQLPDIDTGDDFGRWQFKPHLSAKQHKSVLASLFDDQIGNELAVQFYTLFPPEIPNPAIDGPLSPASNAAAMDERKGQVGQLLEKMDALLKDLRLVEEQTDELDIRLHYIEIYHSYFRSLLRSRFHPRQMLLSELLAAVKWLYTYTTLVEQMLGHTEASVRMCSDFDSLIDELMDEHDEQQKARIIGWVGNILHNEENNTADKDDEGYYFTSGPQDLFLNINSLYDHAVQSDLGAKALFRIAIMYAHVLLYFQECLKRYLAHLEVTEESDTAGSTGGGLLALTDVSGLRAADAAAGVPKTADSKGVAATGWLKPTSFLLAQINNSKAYEADTEDMRSHVLDTLHELADEQLDDVDDTFDEVGDGFFDVATAALRVLVKRSIKPLLPYLSGLFTTSHVGAAGSGYLRTNVLDKLTVVYNDVSSGVNREALISKFVQETCVSMLNIYVRALLTNLHKSGEKLQRLMDVTTQDRSAIIGFYREWNDYLPEDILIRRLALLTAIQKLARDKGNDLLQTVQSLKHLLANDAVVTPYVTTNAILEMRTDMTHQEKSEILELFPEESAEQKGNKLKRVTLSDLSFLSTTATSYQLEVTAVRGDGLAPKDGETSDPFVLLYLMEDLKGSKPLTMRRTKWLPKTLQPVWNMKWSDFSAKDVSSVKCLLFEVWDHDVLGSDFMGQAVLTMEQIRQQKLLNINLQSLSAASITSTQYLGNKTGTDGRGTGADKRKDEAKRDDEKHDIREMTFTLPLTQRDGVKNAGDDLVSGTLTINIGYYHKPPTGASQQPVNIPQSLITPPLQAPVKPAAPQPATATTRSGPKMLDLSTGAIMAGLDRGPDTSNVEFAPPPTTLAAASGALGGSLIGLPTTEAAHRSLLDKVMFRHRKAIVPAEQTAEQAEIARLREKERQRKEEELEQLKADDVAKQNHAAISRLEGRAGHAATERRWTSKKSSRSWWGGGRSTKGQLRKQRLDEQKEREKRYKELKSKEKETEWIQRGALSQAMEQARGKAIGGTKKANDCTIM